MPIIELVRDISYTTISLNFMLLDQLLFELTCKNTHTQQHTHTHRDSYEYPVVAFSKNAIINRKCSYFNDFMKRYVLRILVYITVLKT